VIISLCYELNLLLTERSVSFVNWRVTFKSICLVCKKPDTQVSHVSQVNYETGLHNISYRILKYYSE